MLIQQRLMIAAVGVMACTLASTSAQANLVTFGVSGYVTVFEGEQSVGWSIPIGTSFYGTFAFDSSVIDSAPDDPTIGQYFNSILSSSFWLEGTSLEDTGTTSHIFVMNDLDGNDQYKVQDSSLKLRDHNITMTMFFADTDATIFDDDSLPLVPPLLSNFEFYHWQMQADNFEFVVVGTITSLTLMPEPTTALSLLGGTVVLLRRTRRR